MWDEGGAERGVWVRVVRCVLLATSICLDQMSLASMEVKAVALCRGLGKGADGKRLMLWVGRLAGQMR